MEPWGRQLDELKRKLARIDARYAAVGGSARTAANLPGCEEQTAAGAHWVIDRQWQAQARHGNADVGALSELPEDLLAVLEPEDAITSPCGRWAFLDTETSGLSGGAGTLAFLIGVGWISEHGFELRQYFIRDHGEETSALTALTDLLSRFDVLVTYNGKAFDQPLLESRYVLSRLRPPFARMRHVDLLFSARRLWRLALESCRLKELESRILGVERIGDPDGALIPQMYFEWLRRRDARPLLPVFEHNALDILSLACLTALVPAAFRDPGSVKNGAEMVSLARWLRGQGRLEEAAGLMRSALGRPLSEPLVWDTLWQLADIERRLGRRDAALAGWTELSTATNPWRASACERLAIHYEHREKNVAMALEMTRAALVLEPSEELKRREERLLRKAAEVRSGRLL